MAIVRQVWASFLDRVKDHLDARIPPASGRDADLRPMDSRKAIRYNLLVWLVPMPPLLVVAMFIGFLVDHAISVSVGAATFWSIVFWGSGLMIIRHECFRMYERLGEFVSVKYGGLRWRNRFLDYERYQDTLLARPHQIYEDEAEAEFDFTDFSAVVDAIAWYSIVRPADVASKNRPATTLQIARWVYRFHQPERRVGNIIDGELRPKLQDYDFNMAQKNGQGACVVAAKAAKPVMAKLGAYLAEPEGIIVKDIKTPPEVKELRKLEAEGRMKGGAAAARLAGPSGAMIKVKKDLEAAFSGEEVSLDKAQGIVNQAQVIEAIRDGNGNFTFITPDANGLMKTFNVGNTGG